MTDDQPRRFVAGDRIPFTLAELVDLLQPGTVITASLLNDALDRLRAADPDGKLPAHIQARIDAGQSEDVAAEWRAQHWASHAGDSPTP